MIVSTLTCAAAAASKIIAATPGRSGIPASVKTTSDSEYVTAETIGCSIPSTSCTQVPSSSENVDARGCAPRGLRASWTERSISTLAPDAAISSISS